MTVPDDLEPLASVTGPQSPHEQPVRPLVKSKHTDAKDELSRFAANAPTDPPQVMALIQWVEEQAKSCDYWFGKLWGAYLTLTGIGWTLAALLPFGLAILLFVPSENSRRFLNILMLLLSSASLASLVLASVMRFRERAVNNRRVRTRLRLALRRHSVGQLSVKGLLDAVAVALEMDTEEAAP
jgi:hypothetical protein